MNKAQIITILGVASVSTIAAVVFIVVVLIKAHKLKNTELNGFFSVEDIFKSKTASKLNIDNRTDDEEILLNGKNLIIETLEPARKIFDFDIISFYRSDALNTAVGSKAKESQHKTAEAADITTGSKEKNKQLFAYIRENLPYDQLIAEYDFKTVHVSNKRIGINRKQTLATNDLITYTKI